MELGDFGRVLLDAGDHPTPVHSRHRDVLAGDCHPPVTERLHLARFLKLNRLAHGEAHFVIAYWLGCLEMVAHVDDVSFDVAKGSRLASIEREGRGFVPIAPVGLGHGAEVADDVAERGHDDSEREKQQQLFQQESLETIVR